MMRASPAALAGAPVASVPTPTTGAASGSTRAACGVTPSACASLRANDGASMTPRIAAPAAPPTRGARADFQPLAWIKQAASNANGKIPMVIMRCNGQGEDAGEYLAFVKVKDIMPILHLVVPTDQPARCDKCGSWTFMERKCLSCQLMNTNA